MVPKRKRFIICICLLVGIVFVAYARHPSSAQQQPADRTDAKGPQSSRTKIQELMRGKLQAANKILEGLTTENFQLIESGGKSLSKIRNAEEWRISNNVMYRQSSNEFQRKVDRLARTAKDEKLDAAALAYIEVTMSCIECHKWVRAVLMADATSGSAFSRQGIEK